MDQLLIDIVGKLGVSAFAIYIMYKMHIRNVEWHELKDKQHAEHLKEERDYFRRFSEQVRDETSSLMAKNSQVISENTKVFERVVRHLERVEKEK